MARAESDPAEKYCWTLLKPQETLFKNWKTWIWKRKKFFIFLTRRLQHKLHRSFFFIIFGETPKSKMSISLFYQIMFICNKTKQNKLSWKLQWRRLDRTGRICAVVTESHQDTIKYNVDITNHTHNIEIARKNRLESKFM